MSEKKCKHLWEDMELYRVRGPFDKMLFAFYGCVKCGEQWVGFAGVESVS